MNLAVVVGNICQDIELRYTQSNKAVVRITVAVNRGTDSNGNKLTDYIDCVVWEKQAENLHKYCKKGSKVGLRGSIKKDNYEDEQGNKHYRVYVLVHELTFLSSKQNTEPLPTEPDYLQNNNVSTEESDSDLYDEFAQEVNPDDLPF